MGISTCSVLLLSCVEIQPSLGIVYGQVNVIISIQAGFQAAEKYLPAPGSIIISDMSLFQKGVHNLPRPAVCAGIQQALKGPGVAGIEALGLIELQLAF